MSERFGVRLAVVCLALSFAACAVAAPPAANRAARIDDLVSEYNRLDLFHGAVLVADKDGVVFKKGYGFANREWAIPNAPDTRFRLASVSKQFTAMLVLQLVRDGKLRLDETLAEALPYYRRDTGAKVTIHNLLNHTSGIPEYLNLPGFVPDEIRRPHETIPFVKQFCSGDLEFEPGTKMKYSNSGYYLLGAIVERVAGKPFEEVLSERVLQPLGMRATGCERPSRLIEKRADGYEKRLNQWGPAMYIDLSNGFGAGDMYSTVEDMFLWDRALYTDKLLAGDLKKKMFTPGLENYAYGWGVRRIPLGPGKAERTVAAHAGGIQGFNTLIRRILEDQVLVVLLANNSGDHDVETEISDGVFDVLYGREPAPPKIPISDELRPLIEEKGAPAAIQRYQELKSRSSSRYAWGESQLNLLGYELLGRRKIQEAIAIFELNVQQFPGSWNVYDSLAEAQAAAGRTQEAVRNYKKSLEINPANRNAAEQLKKLATP